MSTTNGVKISFGAASWMTSSVDEVRDWLKLLQENKINLIDTAAIYGGAEETMGKAGAASNFTIDTKMAGGFGGEPSTKDATIAAGKACLKNLNTTSVDVFYIHAPDRRLPVKETLSGLNELYKQGAFKRLGLSNFLGSEIEEIVQVAKENNFVVPSVYQGNYSAVARRADDEIFPIIRKHNMAFYAYSPIAGGFLSKSKATLTEADGRFGENNLLNKVYNGMYNRPAFIKALDVWEQIAQDEKVSRAELAYRWVVYHSKLQGDQDAIIIGARKPEQFIETLQALKAGPLSEGAAQKIDQIWESVAAEAGLDNLNSR